MPRSCLPACKSRFERGGKVSQEIPAELRPIFYPRAVMLVAASNKGVVLLLKQAEYRRFKAGD